MDSNLPPENTPPPVFNAPPPQPPYTPPPPIIPPAPAPRPPKRGGTGWKVLALILFVLLIASVALNVGKVSRKVVGGRSRTYRANSGAYGPRLEEITLKESPLYTTNKIAVVPVTGIISGDAMQDSDFSLVTVIKEELQLAKKDDDVRAVILKVDSPGGEVLASDEIAKAIIDFRDKSHKPVIVSMGSLAASGGYYVSAPCDWIVANELTITGSIGVIMHGLNYRGLLDKIGVQPEVFKSGKFKDMLSPTKKPEEISPEEKQMVQDLITETYDKFKSVVADGRKSAFRRNKGQKLSDDWTDYADGRILSGKQAYKLGFVDEIGDFDTTVDTAKRLAGIGRADIVEYKPIFDLSNIFRLFGETDAKKTVKVELGVDVPKLHAGYLYFLAPTYLQ
ncbi:MAG TPA: signal peptide peptidase SppA [Verrucomicrobiae bacterium]|jgi:protease-4|nr:signal peptide peptidase SppA [Verrucomicrobiae bacterium]